MLMLYTCKVIVYLTQQKTANMQTAQNTETVKFPVGTKVEKMGSAKDYATGRTGEVIELSEIQPGRRRVLWTNNPSGSPMKPIRTWVNIVFLSAVKTDKNKDYTSVVANLVDEYMADPNCSPELWITSASLAKPLNQGEIEAFLFHVKELRRLRDQDTQKFVFTLRAHGASRNVALNGVALSPKKSQEIWNHSPDGFNWGYNGSGPAQLALATLLEIMPQDMAMKWYQHFKSNIIASMPQPPESWCKTITIEIVSGTISMRAEDLES